MAAGRGLKRLTGEVMCLKQREALKYWGTSQLPRALIKNTEAKFCGYRTGLRTLDFLKKGNILKFENHCPKACHLFLQIEPDPFFD